MRKILEESKVIASGGKPKIEDAGAKFGGARKDMLPPASVAIGGYQQEALLEVLWPKPGKWTDLVPSLGPHRAAFVMVAYENIAKTPHRNGWLGVDGRDWERAYRFGISVIRELLLQPGKPNLPLLQTEFDLRMSKYKSATGSKPATANLWSYAVGRAGTRRSRHPFGFTAIDALRARYLGDWGWGSDPRVTNDLAMGALSLTDKRDGKICWKSVKGESRGWVFLDDQEFDSEQQAIDCTKAHVIALLATAKPKGIERMQSHNWIRPHVSGGGLREGFDNSNAQGRSHLELLDVFGFRGVEFGNWVSQSERQQFVDAAYDAFHDLTKMLGMPPSFASLGGKLGLAYGSRGKALSNGVAHFEPDTWVLHFTKESGPGSVAHEFGHALDAWIADHLWRRDPFFSQFASTNFRWNTLPNEIAISEISTAVQQWKQLTFSKMEWVANSKRMDATRKTAYWSDPCEVFARAFEVLVMDSLKAKRRHNDMLVYGIDEMSGNELSASGKSFPYPLGDERELTCESVAVVVRAYRNEFRKRST